MTNSNLLLKAMVSNSDKYFRNKLVSTLRVNIQECEPILNPVYNASMKNNFFIFLNSNNRILGALIGSEVQKNFNNDFAIYTDYYKNRKHLSQNAVNVLMFTPEMRTFTIKNRNNNRMHDAKREARQKLMQRLNEYKYNKYLRFSHDDIISMSQNILVKLSMNLNNDQLINILKPVKSSWDKNAISLIQTFTKELENYISNYERVESQKSYYDNDVTKTWNYNEYVEYRNQIIRWNTLLKQI